MHTYSAAGNYMVTLTAGNEYGMDTKTSKINLKNAPPKTPSEFNFLIFGMIMVYLCKKLT